MLQIPTGNEILSKNKMSFEVRQQKNEKSRGHLITHQGQLFEISNFVREPFVRILDVNINKRTDILLIKCEKLLQCTVMILIFWTERSGQIVQTQIRLLLEEQSDQGLHCLLIHLHLFDKIPQGLVSLFEF